MNKESIVKPKIYRNWSDSTKLRLLADWFDKYDKEHSEEDNKEVQKDLRRMADMIEDITLSNEKIEEYKRRLDEIVTIANTGSFN